MNKFPCIIFLFSTLCFSQVQQLDTLSFKIKPLNELELKALEAAYALKINDVQAIRDSKQQISLEEYLNFVPGLFVLSRNNFSQDLRISIRGFGARSAFGIRGIKLVVDGIPETTPDGQGQIDNLTLGNIDQLQVLRGPASLLYGNASGGVINISTTRQTDSTFTQFAVRGGNYQMQKYDATAAIKHKKGSTFLNFTRTTSDGYRDFSGFKSSQFSISSTLLGTANEEWKFQANYTDSPNAFDAGGLTIEEVREDRRQARSQNVRYDSQEQVRQFKTGLSYSKDWHQIGFDTYAFYSYRDFDNKLPFENGGQVELYRNYYGQGSYITYDTELTGAKNQIQLGYSVAFQADQRKRYQNNLGDRGELSFDQLESFNTLGVYLIDQLELGSWNIHGGIRYDVNRLMADDRTIANNCGVINLNSWSGSVGAIYEALSNHYMHTTFSTSFETPALSELSSNPRGNTGFNQDLEPQNSINLEIGFKGDNGKLKWDAAVFYIDTQDELVPFELASEPGRTFYRNAGSSKRVGWEFYGQYQISPKLFVESSYTVSKFTYDEYELDGTSLKGNSLPGLPEYLASAGLTYKSQSRYFVQWNTTYRGSLFANDQNTVLIDDAWISDVSMSYPVTLSNFKVTLLGGVNNLFDSKYFDNVRINAFGNRYYEPAPGINFYAGLNFRW